MLDYELAVVGGGPAGMAAAVAAQKCNNSVTITNAQSVAKSYPAFFSISLLLGDFDAKTNFIFCPHFSTDLF